jgi:integrase
VRARVVDPTTARMKEIRKVLEQATENEAFNYLETEKTKIRAGLLHPPPRRTHFGDYAVSILEKKIAMGDLSTLASREKWRHTLEHLIGGTTSDDGTISIRGFGDLLIDQIRASHIDAWKIGVTKLIRAGFYKPTTANSWLAILRVILRAAKRDLGLQHNAAEDVTGFDVSNHATYTAEAPNALSSEQAANFLQLLRDSFPQHYAMAYLGMVTGLRPSSLRPLRRSGASPDVDWAGKRLLVRRSQTRGDEVRNATKQGTRYVITLPDDVLEVLKWHVDRQLTTDAQLESELLFPAVDGGFRARSVLDKPFAVVSTEMGLGFRLTPRGMRRTFNDLARTAEVQDLVTRSISGHATERMQHHYSTVRGDEQRRGIAKVIDLVTARASMHAATTGSDHAEYVGASPSGTSGGTRTPPSGTRNEKAG